MLQSDSAPNTPAESGELFIQQFNIPSDFHPSSNFLFTNFKKTGLFQKPAVIALQMPRSDSPRALVAGKPSPFGHARC